MKRVILAISLLAMSVGSATAYRGEVHPRDLAAYDKRVAEIIQDLRDLRIEPWIAEESFWGGRCIDMSAQAYILGGFWELSGDMRINYVLACRDSPHFGGYFK